MKSLNKQIFQRLSSYQYSNRSPFYNLCVRARTSVSQLKCTGPPNQHLSFIITVSRAVGRVECC